ncbi:MAG: patatin-like phospholipase family protein [Acidobacteria bacterium]|nr:patatin-like phospholipase family protein [Acidobacteriota bacterium]
MSKIKKLIALLCLLSLTPFGTSAQTQTSLQQPRPLKIGLVLSGGGARGVAHIGVLEWFEQNHIPVHFVAGTSMGGLVGAFYSMGASPAEMRQLIKDQNWTELLSSGPSFEKLSFRRKQDKRDYQSGLEIGLRKGVSLPLGISSAHYIGLLIDRLALPYYDLKSFDDLPIPFRCVATDFLAAKPVVMKDGSLASAMRATMSIPGVFPPVERDGKVLVDGGLVNNIPTDVIREFQPDVVIAVDTGTPLGDMQAIASIVGILQQSVTVMTINNDRQNLRLADIIIAPDLGNISALDFIGLDNIADVGFKAAAAKTAVLSRFALNDADWQQHLAERQAKRRTAIPTPTDLQIAGVEADAEKALRRRLNADAGKPLDTKKLENDLTVITGQGRYEGFNYGLKAENHKTILEIRPREKSHAPPAIAPGVEVDGSEVNAINFTIGARATFFDVGSYGAELRIDAKVGFGNLFATEYFKPLGERGFFVAPRATYRRDRQGIFAGRNRLAEYQADRFSAGGDFGFLRGSSELRVGYEYTQVLAKASTGSLELPAFDGNFNVARIRWAFDKQDSATVPTRGLRMTAEARWYFSAPNVKDDFPQGETRVSFFVPLSSQGSMFLAGAAGTALGREVPPIQQFLLGGPFRFGAYSRDELRVNQYFLATGGYLHKINELPSLIGGNIYVGAWFDQLGASGGFTSQFDSQRYRAAMSLGLVMDTKVGPFSIVGSRGEGGRGKIYFSLGRFF